jgi:hypothetical protein
MGRQHAWKCAGGTPAQTCGRRVHVQCVTLPPTARPLDARAYFPARLRSRTATHSHRNAGGKSPDSLNVRVCRNSIRSWVAGFGRRWLPSSVRAARGAVAMSWSLFNRHRRNDLGAVSRQIPAAGRDPRVARRSGGWTASDRLRNRPGYREDNRQHLWRGASPVGAGLTSGSMVG